jgi:protein-tyrosine phosphatase
MSSSKRSRSSSTQPETPSEVDRPETVTQPATARDHESDGPPKMPLFLQQSPSGRCPWSFKIASLLQKHDLLMISADIQAKFHELTWIERNRIAQGTMDPSPDHPWAIIQGPQTKLLDRYQNVFPWKHNRIRLRVPEGQNDYINASPISLKSVRTGKESKYIAMQGPKEGSTSHVWRMIWDELTSPAVIVMLTETHEAGMEKCFPYFPTDPDAPPLVINENDEFGDGFKATVKCLEVDAHTQAPSTEVRKLAMNVDGQEQEKIIWHLLYTKWPDFGVLAGEDLDGFFKLMDLSNQKNSGPENPRIIHCSAGVGRSGTFIALEYLMAELEADALVPEPGEDEAEYDPVFDTVNRLREQRRTMVQADSQYLFIYSVLRQLWEQKHPVTTLPLDKTTKGEPTAKVAKLGEMEDVFS